MFVTSFRVQFKATFQVRALFPVHNVKIVTETETETETEKGVDSTVEARFADYKNTLICMMMLLTLIVLFSLIAALINAKKRSFRSVEVEETTGSSFFQISKFEDSKCHKLGYEELIRANYCFRSSEPNKFMKARILSKSDGYRRILEYYSDGNCTRPFHGTQSNVALVAKHKCEKKGKGLLIKNYQVKNRQSTGVTLGFFSDQTSCKARDQSKLQSASFSRYGYCLREWSNDGYDMKFTGCKNGVVSWTKYSSNDGRCSGVATSKQFGSADVCQSPVSGPLDSPSWINAYCP